MKRVIVLALVVAITLGGVTWIVVSQSGFTEPAQAALRQYADGRAVLRMARAARPWNLRPEMSATTFGRSVRYEVDYNSQAIQRTVPTVIGTPGLDRVQIDGQMPLPYPPEDVWCVQLSTTREGQPHVVFVAYHQDLYNGAWVVHEPAVTGLADDLAQLGCDLSRP